MKESEIAIKGEPTLESQICRFIVSYPIYPAGTFNCRTREMAEGSPLLEALFAIEGIREIMVSGNTLTIAKSTPDPWPELGKQIGAVIREKIASGKQLLASDLDKKTPSEEKIRQRIEELFTNEINPAISSHGGWVELVNVEGSKVYVRLGGGCQGCASANATLKQGIERAIRNILPEVTEVLDATDHAAGQNPYYR